MTEGKNIFSRFFRVLVMLHKIPYARFTEWNNKRKRKAFAAGIYFLSILPEFVLLVGTMLAATGQDGYVHLANVPQKIVFYGLAGVAVLLSAIPLGFFDDKKICREVRRELRERPRYWKRATAVYWAVIVAMVVAVNMAFPTAPENTIPAHGNRGGGTGPSMYKPEAEHQREIRRSQCDGDKEYPGELPAGMPHVPVTHPESFRRPAV